MDLLPREFSPKPTVAAGETGRERFLHKVGMTWEQAVSSTTLQAAICTEVDYDWNHRSTIVATTEPTETVLPGATSTEPTDPAR